MISVFKKRPNGYTVVLKNNHKTYFSTTSASVKVLEANPFNNNAAWLLNIIWRLSFYVNFNNTI